ncbi:LysR substrate-binding domain-containing protein [Sneathiella limimaris]|uniref:LysR substrate-binding domain-containing protein n=1 Tax=Sneathiella limimaris TaxID=1964213 RepID=UPI0019D027E7|nr:LysR substrate-binding domain-containing protein [Sneathiella limimaris]
MMTSKITNLPPMNGFKTFEVVARHLNFRLAAEELGVTHGAVAQQIRGLEASLQVKLFNRLPRGLSLTEEGKTLTGPVSEAISILREATDKLKSDKSVINISLTPSLATKWLLPRLGILSEKYPEIDIQILATETLSDLTRDNVDIAIRQGRPPFGRHLQADPFLSITHVAVCSPPYKEKLDSALKSDSKEGIVFLSDAHNRWSDYLEMFYPDLKRGPKNTMSFNQTALAIDAAISHQGLALVAKALVAPELENGRLQLAFSEELESDDGYYLLTTKKQTSLKPVSMVRSWLLQQATP